MPAPANSLSFVDRLVAVQPRLFGYLVALLPDPDEAREVLQETNRAILAKNDACSETAKFESWAMEICRLAFLSHVRDKKRDRHLFYEDLSKLVPSVVDSPDLRTGPSVLEPSDPRQTPSFESLAGSIDQRNQLEEKLEQDLFDELAADPDCLLLYDFDYIDPVRRRVINRCKHSTVTHGTLIGCSSAPGVSRSNRAVEFNDTTDRVRTHIPGRLEEFTMATWIHFDTLPANGVSAILMSEGWEPGDGHFQIFENRLVLGMRRQAAGFDFRTAPIFHDPSLVNRFIHLAATWKSHGGPVKLYVEGTPVRVEVARDGKVLPRTKAHSMAVATDFGTVDIGNWNPNGADGIYPFRNTIGRMDSLLVMQRVMNANEIKQLYLRRLPDRSPTE